MPEHPWGALAGHWGLGWEGCCGREQHPPARVLVAAGAVLSPGQRRRMSPSQPQDKGAQPSPGNPLAVSEAVRSPDRARCQCQAPQHAFPRPWGLAGGVAPGCRTGLALVIGAADNLRLGWARALLLSLHSSCRTSPASGCGVAGAVPGLPLPRALHLPQPPWDPAGAEGVRLGALGAASWLLHGPGLLPHACRDPSPCRARHWPGTCEQSRAEPAGAPGTATGGLFLEKQKFYVINSSSSRR